MINVLIVDDDAMVAELNRRYVAQLSGFHCCGTASTLEKAKEILFHGEHHIDLILLDIYMQKRTVWICCPFCIAKAANVTSLSSLPPPMLPPLRTRSTTGSSII